ncbi:MAG: hypothetical protein QOJ99_4708 [Bryobacterales bacterium]|jgi:hypothetical protein|nr:hypothetical protein [Bryobacterales bacterium]
MRVGRERMFLARMWLIFRVNINLRRASPQGEDVRITVESERLCKHYQAAWAAAAFPVLRR